MSATGRSFGRNNPGLYRFERGGYRMADESRGRPYGQHRGFGGYMGGGKRSSGQGSWGRKKVGHSRGAPFAKMLHFDDDGRKAGSQFKKGGQSQFDPEVRQNPNKFLLYCALCTFNTLEVKEMDSHMEGDEHKNSLLLVDKHFPKEKMLSRFLHERIQMLNKRTQISKRIWEEKYGASYKIEGMELPDCMQLSDVVRCPACRSYIPALEWEVQVHLQSMRHASNFQDIQSNHFEKIRDIVIKVLNKRGDNLQYERFKKGEDPFAKSLLALEKREEPIVEAKEKKLSETKNMEKKNLKRKSHDKEKEEATEEKQEKDKEQAMMEESSREK
uniref:Uncharacterized protein n=1 Tax=Eptatretus burgeri TaxID=7764 RepID=A0A8C4QHU4_EPTBU